MRFPSVPIDKFHIPPEEMAEGASGISVPWHKYFTDLTQGLQRHFNISGLLANVHNNIDEANINNNANRGKLSFNQETKEMKVNNEGTYKPIAIITEQLTTAEIATKATAANTGKFYEDTQTNTLHYILNGALKEVTLT